MAGPCLKPGAHCIFSWDVRMITALFSVLLLASEAAVAVSATPAEAPAAVEAPKEEKKICKREAATESRLGAKRICLTAAQWKDRQQKTGFGDVSK